MAGLRSVTLRQLQIFCSAARHSSFSRASAELHLTQPGVSMQMRQLEDSAGLPLFERTGKGLHLTDAGRELLRHAQQALAALRDAEDSLDALKGLKGGRLTIAAVSTAKYLRAQAAGPVLGAASGRGAEAVGQQSRSGRPAAGRQ